MPGLSVNANGTFASLSMKLAVLRLQPQTLLQCCHTRAWVASAPHDTESMGLTFQKHGFDLGAFGKRVGSRWADIGNYHQTVAEDPFWMNNIFLNYTSARTRSSTTRRSSSASTTPSTTTAMCIGAANDGTTLATPSPE